MGKILIAGLLLGGLLSAAAAERPNVILIMTDDQGYGDTQSHGNPVLKTPAMDKLRQGCVRPTDFHVAPMCAPTKGRRALLVQSNETKWNGNRSIIFLKAPSKTADNLRMLIVLKAQFN